MDPATGDNLGPYALTEVIGRGGMGQVWKANDTRLNRVVAIKTSSSQFSERFEREARTIATLNHPHICSLYDVGAAPDGSSYLVMEYVQGKAARGPMPITVAIRYARQILAGMDAAHSKGIVHRDLKPENILIGAHGVKILDFGIAKLTQPAQATDASGGTTDSTAESLTNAGAMIGTLQYMSPEQIEGKPADVRSDIFAFGLVLYELITGEPPFSGSSQASLIASILKDEPKPIHDLKPVAPRALDRIIGACLEKDPDRRWQSASDVARALDLIESGAGAEGDFAAHASRRGWLWPVLGSVVATAAIAVTLGFTLRPAPIEPVVTRFEVSAPDGVEFSDTRYVRLSPDGRRLAFTGVDESGTSALWVHDFTTGTSRRLPGTEGARSPSWSPDGQWLAFGAVRQLKKVSLDGSPPQLVTTLENFVGSGAWTGDGRIVFGGAGAGTLQIVSAAGGEPVALTLLDRSRGETTHALPTMLPDGRHFLYLRSNTDPNMAGIYAGSIDLPPDAQSEMQLLQTEQNAVFVESKRPPGGYLFYLRDGILMARAFDPDALELVGDPVTIVRNVGNQNLYAAFSVSADGTLAYRAGDNSLQRLTWLDRRGRTLGTVGEPGAYRRVELSPNGSKAILLRDDMAATGYTWILDLDQGLQNPFTFGDEAVSSAIWAPDGETIAYGTNTGVYTKPASGVGNATLLSSVAGAPNGWTSDGRFLLFEPPGEIQWLDRLAGQAPQLLLGGSTATATFGGQLSPDDRWLAYISAETGRREVWLRPVRRTDSSLVLGDGKWQVTRDGATMVRWRGDSQELIFRNLNGPLVAIGVDASGDAPVFAAPSTLFRPALALDASWDVTSDGERFLMAVRDEPDGRSPTEVIMNWQALLE